ncbi:hypothetical protein Tco_0668117 [Tanacetum coccineum]
MVEGLVNYHLKEIHCSSQCHTQKTLWIIVKGDECLILCLFEIVERVGLVAYRLRLPQELVGVHNTFHVLNLKKCLADVTLHVPLEEVKINDKLHFVEEPMEIMDREVKKLKKRRIPIVKVCWKSRRGPEFTWEREDEMKRKSWLGFVIAAFLCYFHLGIPIWFELQSEVTGHENLPLRGGPVMLTVLFDTLLLMDGGQFLGSSYENASSVEPRDSLGDEMTHALGVS